MVLMGMDLPLPAIQRQIASGLDIIVHLGRLRDKTRKVLEVTEVLGYWEEEIHLQTLYCFEEAYKEAMNVTEDEEKREIRMERKVSGDWKKIAELCHREKLMAAGYTILIGGGTGSGKTTFLNALSEYIPKDERVITIEDNAELQIQGIENLVRLECRPANIEKTQEITIGDLLRTCLRMRPSRIIVGEVRGKEAAELLQVVNIGNDGSLSTIHANSCKDMVSRLETMVLMGIDLPIPVIRRQIVSGFDIFVHLGRMSDKSRKVLEICEIKEISKEGEVILNPLFIRSTNLEKKGHLYHTEKLTKAGIAL